jgi:hypothetical protein
MKISKIQKGLVLLTITAGVFAAGCELIVDFDRTKIPVETPDTGAPDGNVPETSTPSGDGGSDAGDGGSNTSDAGDADADA